MKFDEMMTLYEREPDTYVGTGPSYPWGGLFGGQIVAQALRAAASTVEPAFGAHSLHAYFIRRGDASEPIRFEVDRLRNGRNFLSRAVVARQSMGAILHMSASFSQVESNLYWPSSLPSVPDPDTIDDNSWSRLFERRFIQESEGRALAWLRVPDVNPDDSVLAACALAYVSDDLATDAVRSQQQHLDQVSGRHWDGTSLDHAIWFHRPFAADAWQLHDFHCDSLDTPRGLAVGQVYAPDGGHLATVAQEVLLRKTT